MILFLRFVPNSHSSRSRENHDFNAWPGTFCGAAGLLYDAAEATARCHPSFEHLQ